MGLEENSNTESNVSTQPIFADVKVIFFDLDDTLCAYWDAAKKGLRISFDAHPTHGTSTDEMIGHWGEAFREFAPTIKDTHWYEKYLKSGEITRVELMRRTLERAGSFDEELAVNLSNTYYVERHAALELFPEANDVLKKLDEHYKMGLITNGPADIQRQEIETLNISEFIDYVLIEGEMLKGKPNPSVMEKAEQMSGYKGQEILFVGNSFAHDIKPAMAAGWRHAWIRRPSDVPPTSQKEGPAPKPEGEPDPDLIINDLRELLPALGLD